MERMSINFFVEEPPDTSPSSSNKWVLVSPKDDILCSPSTNYELIEINDDEHCKGKWVEGCCIQDEEGCNEFNTKMNDVVQEDLIVSVLMKMGRSPVKRINAESKQHEVRKSELPNLSGRRRRVKTPPMRSCKKLPRLVSLPDENHGPAGEMSAIPPSEKGTRVQGNECFMLMQDTGESEGVDDDLVCDNDDKDEDYEEPSTTTATNSAKHLNIAHGSEVTIRSFACDKHSKWKKKCPWNCPRRREMVTAGAQVRRKLWTKKESALLLKWVKEEDPQYMSSKDSEQRWVQIAKLLNRSVNSTKKKFMRLTNQWSPKPAARSKSRLSSDEDLDDDLDEPSFDELIQAKEALNQPIKRESVVKKEQMVKREQEVMKAAVIQKDSMVKEEVTQKGQAVKNETVARTREKVSLEVPPVIYKERAIHVITKDRVTKKQQSTKKEHIVKNDHVGVEEHIDSGEEYGEVSYKSHDIRGLRSGRATVVCEKHRRWKKRCPPDCVDKKEAEKRFREREAKKEEQQITHQEDEPNTIVPSNTNLKRKGTGRGVGRPAQSCRQHQLEHQKCPEDCPRRPIKKVKVDTAYVRNVTNPKLKGPPRSIAAAASAPPSVSKRASRRLSDPSFLYI
jgi:hypothetical protein